MKLTNILQNLTKKKNFYIMSFYKPSVFLLVKRLEETGPASNDQFILQHSENVVGASELCND